MTWSPVPTYIPPPQLPFSHTIPPPLPIIINTSLFFLPECLMFLDSIFVTHACHVVCSVYEHMYIICSHWYLTLSQSLLKLLMLLCVTVLVYHNMIMLSPDTSFVVSACVDVGIHWLRAFISNIVTVQEVSALLFQHILTVLLSCSENPDGAVV